MLNQEEGFQESAKKIINLDSENNRRHSFIIDFSKGSLLIHIHNVDDDLQPAIEYYLIPYEDNSIFFMRDSQKLIPTLARGYQQDGRDVFELLDTDGSKLQIFVLDAMFPGNLVKAYMKTWLLEDGFFEWRIIGQLEGGAYVSHVFPNEDESLDGTGDATIEHSGDAENAANEEGVDIGGELPIELFGEEFNQYDEADNSSEQVINQHEEL